MPKGATCSERKRSPMPNALAAVRFRLHRNFRVAAYYWLLVRERECPLRHARMN